MKNHRLIAKYRDKFKKRLNDFACAKRVPLSNQATLDLMRKREREERITKGGRGTQSEADENKTIGKYSKRPFDINKAGGEIKDLDWREVRITKEGIEDVKKHLNRFGDDEANKAMIERLEKIERNEIEITDYDKRFYTHELRELERFRNLGIPDNERGTYEDWNNAHTATLEDYKIDERVDGLYHPSINLD